MLMKLELTNVFTASMPAQNAGIRSLQKSAGENSNAQMLLLGYALGNGLLRLNIVERLTVPYLNFGSKIVS